MAKFYGKIGFIKTEEVEPDIWKPATVEKFYYGDINRNQRRWQGTESINDDIEVSNEISIVMDDFLQKNAGYLKWVEFMGAKWKISSITHDYPRITITLGGVWNGE
jgi:hypothetical protein